MLKTRTGGAAIVALAAVSCAHAQDAVQWRVEDGGNGHWYAFDASSGVSWETARQRAIDLGGDLASIASRSENAWLAGPILGEYPLDAGRQAWLAGRKASGNWYWVDGTNYEFESWHCFGDGSPCQPDNTGAWMSAIWSIGGQLYWNDMYTTQTSRVAGSFIEWSADCNNDGIVDYGQILDGTYADENGNGVPDCCDAGDSCDCPADITEDGRVDAADLGVLLAVWNTDGGSISQADINNDGVVNASDLGVLLGAWGVCSAP